MKMSVINQQVSERSPVGTWIPRCTGAWVNGCSGYLGAWLHEFMQPDMPLQRPDAVDGVAGAAAGPFETDRRSPQDGGQS